MPNFNEGGFSNGGFVNLETRQTITYHRPTSVAKHPNQVKVRRKPAELMAYQTEVELIVPTPIGDMRANPGDWIVIDGPIGNREAWVCERLKFDQLYEVVA